MTSKSFPAIVHVDIVDVHNREFDYRTNVGNNLTLTKGSFIHSLNGDIE